MLVVYENPQTMLFDWRGAYRNQNGFEFIKIVLTIWDETGFIDGKIGEFIIIARRKDNDWFVGGMTDWNSREIKIPLDFLGKGEYKATIYSDGPLADKKPTEVCISHINLSAKDNLSLRMAAGGGYAIQFTPVLKE
jgi:alpha-glucosidase